MAINKVQFQRGMSLPEFLRAYGTEGACESALFTARWPTGFECPGCLGRSFSTFQRDGRTLWQCKGCRRQTSVTAGTIFAHCRVPLTTWFLAIYLLTQTKTNTSALELKRHLGVCYRTAWRMKHKLMQVMEQREQRRDLGGFVQIDDAYLGGERPGGKRGRGSENKRPFVMAVETDEEGHPGCAVMVPVDGFTKEALKDWARRHLRPQTEVYSDGLGAFEAVIDLDHAHTVIQAGTPKEACEASGARWVNNVLGNLKRALDGTYHSFKFFKYAHRYLGEAQWRFNRRFQMDIIVRRLITGAARCKPWPEKALRDIPLFGS